MFSTFTPANLAALSKTYRALSVCSAQRQLGRDACKEAIALGDRNMERTQELFWRAVRMLPYAQIAR